MASNTNLSLVKATGALKKQIGINQLFNEIMDIVNKMGDISSLKGEKALLEHIMQMVENSQTVKLKGNEKKALVIRIVTSLFPILNNEQDLRLLNLDIDYICSKGLINKISLITKASSMLYDCCFKKS